MQLRLVHRTGFTYADGVVASYNEARMTPVTTPDQVVLHSRLEISPTPWVYEYRDYWGAQVTAFEVQDLHHDLTVTAISTVDVARAAPEPALLGWDAITADDVQERYPELLAVSDRTRPPEELRGLAAELRASAAAPDEFARAVCDLVHREVRYVTGSTEVHTLAADSWANREGVCQDMAHLCLGVLREAGVPARYVSGYLHPDPDPEVGVTAIGESHAWLEWWDGAWVGFDPTNDSVPDDRYVTVATGRDYADVAPLVGIFSGGHSSTMFVELEVTRLR